MYVSIISVLTTKHKRFYEKNFSAVNFSLFSVVIFLFFALYDGFCGTFVFQRHDVVIVILVGKFRYLAFLFFLHFAPPGKISYS